MFSKRKTTDVVDGTAAPSLISSDMQITGTVSAEGEMQVDGVVEGTMRATVLVIGETGRVTGEIVGEKITICGSVTGPIRGVDVKLASTARVEGDIVHASLEIKSGAEFEGTIRRSANPIEDVLKQLTGPAGSPEAGQADDDAADEADADDPAQKPKRPVKKAAE